MKRIVLFITVCILGAAPLFADEEKRSIGVLAFSAKNVGEVYAEQAETSFNVLLHKTGRYIILDRANMQKVIEEQELSVSERCDDTQCAIEVGQLLQMQEMVTGKLIKAGSKYILNITIIDVETASVLKTEMEEFYSEDDISIAVHNILVKFFGGRPKRYSKRPRPERTYRPINPGKALLFWGGLTLTATGGVFGGLAYNANGETAPLYAAYRGITETSGAYLGTGTLEYRLSLAWDDVDANMTKTKAFFGGAVACGILGVTGFISSFFLPDDVSSHVMLAPTPDGGLSFALAYRY